MTNKRTYILIKYRPITKILSIWPYILQELEICNKAMKTPPFTSDVYRTHSVSQSLGFECSIFADLFSFRFIHLFWAAQI